MPPQLPTAAAMIAPFVAREVLRVEARGQQATISFLDLETTGRDPARHDILEIGLVRVDARTLEVLAEYETIVAPTRLENAEPEALSIAGFSATAWEKALPLREALVAITPLLDGSLVAGHNVAFDWAFLQAGFERAGLPLPSVDHHRLDTASLAWPLVAGGELPSMSLDPVARLLELPRPFPHRALIDARCSLEVARQLSERMRVGGQIAGLPGDERHILEALLVRLALGRQQYGSWRLDDRRDYPSEAYAEVIDGLHYTAAELVRRRRLETARRRRVYVCHPFSDAPAENIERVRVISLRLLEEGVLPIAPHLYVPQLVDEATARELAMGVCLELLGSCDEVRVFGGLVTEEMEGELREAKRLGIPESFVAEVRP